MPSPIVVGRGQLSRLLSQTIKIVNSSNTIPILATFRLVVENNRLTVTATDLDIEVSGTIDVEGPDAGFCVDAKLFSAIVNKSGEELTIAPEAGKVIVKSGRSRFTLQTLGVEDFPSMEGGKFDAEFEADLGALVAPVSFAMSTEMTRYYLCGVYLQPTAATATDGHRLATIEASLPEFTPVILPSKLVGLVPKGAVAVSISAARIRLAHEGTTITSKLIDGTFPDYERVIPTERNDKIVTVAAEDLRAALGRVSVVASDRGRGVKLSVEGEQMTLVVNNSDLGNATETVDAAYDGELIEIGMNAKYAVDVLGLFPNGPVTIALADGGSPALLTSAGAPGVRAVVMPMRI